ncbi:T9SS type A sorting domain-containing protein [Chitinophaga sp. SYP-B3965]|uniref:T9SS type A sorting domain-containing protein n=1 Tax=Chitinophaga sp. SYP-B3965 TaxID=2663120 RepID=UPI00129A06D1|nr:T9SS type A sorting domain-containing protein [Chitinophaga sp. SYP-B3965]MRG47295.1 T9SS type A sorting domain-containing protein [Chitinophaga sp. SYP-B3965]
MKLKLYYLLLAIAMAIFPRLLSAQNLYYVDVTHPTIGSGTSVDPYNSIGRALNNVPFVNGTGVDAVVYIKRGTYTINPADQTTQIYITGARGGSAGKYFTLKAYPGDEGLVIINGSSLTTNPFFPYMAAIVSTSYVKFEGLTFANLGNTSGYGILAQNVDNIEIKNCTFSNLKWDTDSVQSKYPISTSNFINAIDISGTTSSISLIGNVFQNLALAWGETVKIAAGSTGITQTGSTYSNLIGIASDYYVSLSGNDTTGNGSITKPWKTINKAINTAGINYTTSPASLINAPVNIYLRSGTHKPAGTIFINELRGSNNNWFKIKNYPGEHPTVSGENITAKFSSIFAIAGGKNVAIEGLKITKLTNDSTLTNQPPSIGTKDSRFGIIVSGKSANIVIRKNEIFDLAWTRNTVKQKFPTAFDNLGAIMILGTTDTSIRNVVIDSNTVYEIVPGFTEAITVNGNVDSFSISSNLVFDIANIGIVAAGNYPWVVDDPNYTVTAPNNNAKNGRIVNNTVYRCLSPIAVSAGIYLDGSRNVVVEDNLSYWNGAGCSVGNEQYNSTSGGHTIRNNVFKENLSSGFYYGSINTTSWVEDCVVKWNTIKHNFRIDTVLYNKANGQYGTLSPGGRYVEIQVYRLRNSSFFENEITSNSNIMTGFFRTQSGLSFYDNEYYPVSDDACNALFVQDMNNDGAVGLPQDSIYFSFHGYAKYTGYDQDGSSCAGDIYDPNGCGTFLLSEELMTAKIETPSSDLKISVYPNPVVSDLYVNISLPASETLNIQLVDVSGQTWLQQTRKLEKGTHHMKLTNVKDKHLAAGIYFLRVGKKVVKLIIP